MLGKQKRTHPYVNVAVFGLAAAGVVGIVHKIKKTLKKKCSDIKDMMKSD